MKRFLTIAVLLAALFFVASAPIKAQEAEKTEQAGSVEEPNPFGAGRISFCWRQAWDT